MRLFVVVLVSLIGAQALQMNIQNCKIGSTEVDNYIKYECYTEGNIVRGIRPTGNVDLCALSDLNIFPLFSQGCVPSNDDTGKLLTDGETHSTEYFWYKCSVNGNTAAYEITGTTSMRG